MLPLFQLIKIKRGISEVELSKIIGNYFPEVQDKLLNILQLKEKSKETDLILASVEQKAKQLQPIPFKKAINYRNNSKHIRLLFIPLLILVISMISGTTKELTSSFERVVNHKLTYNPPAPFQFVLAIQGTSVTISVSTLGNLMPENAKIRYNNQEYFMRSIKKVDLSLPLQMLWSLLILGCMQTKLLPKITR